MRFEDQASLKWRLNPAQPRRGGRIALRARIAGALFYSVHLESGGDEQRRANQVRDILASVPPSDEPVIIGGDFNNVGDAASAMFSGLRAAGFTNAMSPAAIERGAARRPIDWIFTKRMTATSELVRAADASDHDPVDGAYRFATTFLTSRVPKKRTGSQPQLMLFTSLNHSN